MRKLMLCVAAAAFLVGAGCAHVDHPAFHQAYYVDQEYGQAQQHSWDLQVAYPDYRYADRTPEGLEGVNAEGVMGVHNQTFSEKPAQAPVMTLGVLGE
ncbi:MAG: hypothetical protein SCH98_15190 [Deferrisomatales bacterium]|nr:hypothetical protein [Deferrisomatales bacterium]